MAQVNIRHQFDQAALWLMMNDPTYGVARDMYKRGQQVRSRAMQLVGVDSGRLRASIDVDFVPREGTLAVRVGTNVEYSVFHDEGHGEIVPRRPGGVLVFKPRGSGRWVFTKRVRAVPGTDYLRRALPAAKD